MSESKTPWEASAIIDTDRLLRKMYATSAAKDTEIARLSGLVDRLRMEAQAHAQESRTQSSTVHECYQAASGSTGERGSWHGAQPVRDALAAKDAEIAALRGENERLREACSKLNDDVCQELGKALGYPWFEDDQENFPGSTSSDGVCVGDHVAVSFASEAAKKIAALRAESERLREALESAVATIKDYLEYEHSGDPWEEDARAMGEMDIDDFRRDGRLDKALSALTAHPRDTSAVVAQKAADVSVKSPALRQSERDEKAFRAWPKWKRDFYDQITQEDQDQWKSS